MLKIKIIWQINMKKSKKREIISFVVPTGIGAKIGGFAGDASAYARKFAQYFDVIVNPNVVNAALFSGITQGMIYCEGFFLDKFFENKIKLKKRQNSHKIGVIFDKAIKKDVLNVHINTIHAIKTVYDYDILPYIITKENVGLRFYKEENGGSFGDVLNPQTLIDAGLKLKKMNATELCVVCNFDDSNVVDNDSENYIMGEGVDIVGGVEAIISHYMSSKLELMTVHAPAFNDFEIEKRLVSPKSASEFVTLTYLPCLFFGLQYAPIIAEKNAKDAIGVKDLRALILPYNSLGSGLVLNALENNVKVIAIKENITVINASAKALGLDDEIIELETYDECLCYLKKQF